MSALAGFFMTIGVTIAMIAVDLAAIAVRIGIIFLPAVVLFGVFCVRHWRHARARKATR